MIHSSKGAIVSENKSGTLLINVSFLDFVVRTTHFSIVFVSDVRGDFDDNSGITISEEIESLMLFDGSSASTTSKSSSVSFKILFYFILIS